MTRASDEYAHLSLEFPHLGVEDFFGSPDEIVTKLGRLRSAFASGTSAMVENLPDDVQPRISTALLIDMWPVNSPGPREVIPLIVDAAAQNGLVIDYLGQYDGLAKSHLCDMVLDRIVEEPPYMTMARPPASETGWLTNGARPYTYADNLAQPGDEPPAWVPPKTSHRHHSIFLDVELFSWVEGQRQWSQAFLYAAWQLARLGMVNTQRLPELIPAPWDGEADSWNDLPAVLQLNPDAAPFQAYHLVSPTGSPRIGQQYAALTILGQWATDQGLQHRVEARAKQEGLHIALEPQERMDYRAMPTVPSLRQRQPRPADPGTLPDRTRSSVILIGTSTHDHYRELDDLPAVAHNLIDLRGALTDPSSGAFEPQRTHVLLDEGPYLPAKIAELGEDVGDTLLVYFAGHGLVAPNGELCLARRDTRPALEAYTTMPFSLLRQAVKDSPAKRKIVILDCCFAGRALPTLLASDPIHGQMEISGTYVLTATADNQPAHVTPGARNSVFTGELLNVLNAGIVDGEELIQLGELYEVLRRRLHASNLPLPRQMGIDTVGSLAIARNPGWTGY